MTHSVFAFLAEISEIACRGRRSGGQPPFDATPNEMRKRDCRPDAGSLNR